MEKTVAIIQARMGSTRLPGKVLKNLCGKPVLEHVIDRVRQSKKIDDIVVATTDLPQDDIIMELSQKCGVKYFRGDEDDVLSRYYYAAKENRAAHIVRITSDCPLYDPNVGDDVIAFFREHDYDIVSNAGALDTRRTFPPGFDTEVFSWDCLKDAFDNARNRYQREHVTPYMYESSSNHWCNYHLDHDCSGYRLTLDTPEDFTLIQALYNHFYKGAHDFYLSEIVGFLSTEPQLLKLNEAVYQKGYTQ